MPIHQSPITIHNPPFRLIVGLGNPGREYERTRHNVGFMILEKLAVRAGATFRAEKNWRAQIAMRDGVHFCKPMTFMNLSGEAVAAVTNFYKIAASETLIVLDDVALPLGKLRLRPDGSAGGHNGLQSVLDHVGSIPRLRVGIGAANGADMTQHVLGRFTADEEPVLQETLERAINAIDFAQTRGLEAAMNQFN